MFGDNNTAFTGWLANVLNEIGLAWWVKVETHHPRCTYYFGPFLTSAEANKEKEGYLQDLKAEGAEGFNVEVLRCRPQQLTIEEDSTTTDANLAKKSPIPLKSAVP